MDINANSVWPWHYKFWRLKSTMLAENHAHQGLPTCEVWNCVHKYYYQNGPKCKFPFDIEIINAGGLGQQKLSQHIVLITRNAQGAAVAEWLSSWLAEQEDRGSIPGLATWIFRDWLSPASKSRYGWKIAKSTLILKTTNQPRNAHVNMNFLTLLVQKSWPWLKFL